MVAKGSSRPFCHPYAHVGFDPNCVGWDRHPSSRDMPEGDLSRCSKQGAAHTRVCFASGFVVSRAQSMNNWVTGLIVRFFNVTIPVGHGGMSSFTGSALRLEPTVLNLRAEAGNTVK